MDWFLYDRGHRHERVKNILKTYGVLRKSIEVAQKIDRKIIFSNS